MSAPDSSAALFPQEKVIPSSGITENDVLLGRGGSINCHPGNEQFRQLVQRKKRVYLTARFKREKRLIASSVVEDIHNLDPPGRFLTKIENPGRRRKKSGEDLGWYEVDDDKARDKTSQALRENAPDVRKEMEVERKQYVMAQQDPNQNQLTPSHGADDEDDYEDKAASPDDMDIDDDGNGDTADLHKGNNAWMPDIHLSSSWSSFKATAAALMQSGEQNQTGTSGQTSLVHANSGALDRLQVIHAQNPHIAHAAHQNMQSDPNRVVRFQEDPSDRKQADNRMNQVTKAWDQHLHTKEGKLKISTKPDVPQTPASATMLPYHQIQQGSTSGHYQPSQFSGEQTMGANHFHQTSNSPAPAAPYYHGHQPNQQQNAALPLHSPINVGSQNHAPSEQLPVYSCPNCQNCKSENPGQGQTSHQNPGQGHTSHQYPYQQAPHLNPIPPQSHNMQQSQWGQDSLRRDSLQPFDIDPISLTELEEENERSLPPSEAIVQGTTESRLDTGSVRGWDWATPFLSMCGSMSRTESIDLDTNELNFCGNLETCSIDSPVGAASLCNVFLDNEPHNKSSIEVVDTDGNTPFRQMTTWANHDESKLAPASVAPPHAGDSRMTHPGVDDPALTLPMLPTPSVDNSHMNNSHMNPIHDEPMADMVHSWDAKRTTE